jgi:hypothetical protein
MLFKIGARLFCAAGAQFVGTGSDHPPWGIVSAALFSAIVGYSRFFVRFFLYTSPVRGPRATLHTLKYTAIAQFIRICRWLQLTYKSDLRRFKTRRIPRHGLENDAA